MCTWFVASFNHYSAVQDTLRKHVESELLVARKKIEAITKKLEEVRGMGAFQPAGQTRDLCLCLPWYYQCVLHGRSLLVSLGSEEMARRIPLENVKVLPSLAKNPEKT